MKTSRNIIKYGAFNPITKQLFLCSSKALLANMVKCNPATIRRKEQLSSSFTVNDWNVFTDVVVHKIKRRGNNFR